MNHSALALFTKKIPCNPHANNGIRGDMQHFRISLVNTREAESMNLYLSLGTLTVPRDRQITLDDVLICLFFDFQCFMMEGEEVYFEQWAMMNGLDYNLIRTLRSYEATKQQFEDLQRVLGEEWDRYYDWFKTIEKVQ